MLIKLWVPEKFSIHCPLEYWHYLVCHSLTGTDHLWDLTVNTHLNCYLRCYDFFWCFFSKMLEVDRFMCLIPWAKSYLLQHSIHKYQGPKGIRQWSINWCTSLMMIHKIILSVDYNYLLKRLDTQSNEPTNQNSIKVPKDVQPTNKKTLLKTLWTSVINSPRSFPCLDFGKINHSDKI